MKYVSIFLFSLLTVFSLTHLQARTVSVPKRETAQVYYLKLTNLSNQESITLESQNAVFELPENLMGEYSLQVSFIDKWGREIPGRGPKIIQLFNRADRIQTRDVKSAHSVVGIIFTPYLASGTFQADISAPLTTVKKMKGTFQSTGINTVLKITTLKKWKLGVDVMQGKNKTTQLNSTEMSILYDWTQVNHGTNHFMLSSGASYVSSQVKDAIQDGASTINSSAMAKSAYIFGNGVFNFHLGATNFVTAGLFGLSDSYIRYNLGQSILYHFSNNFSLGPWVDYSQLENGNKDGAIKANILKLGVSFNFIL